MGIHFVCHHCSYALHVKDFQAGKRGKCPGCNGSFRIPVGDASYSSPIEEATGISPAAKLDPPLSIHRTQSPQLSGDSSGSVSIAIDPSPTAKERKAKKKVRSEREQTTTPASRSIPEQPFLPAALASQLDSKWFVRPSGGGQFGPAPAALLMSWIAESRVTADSLLCREGTAQWQSASELLPELFDGNTAHAANAALSNAIANNGTVQDLSNQAVLMASAASVATGEPTASTVSVDSATLRSDAILKKRMQKRRQQLTLVIILATVSLVLFGILIYVLVSQVGKPPVQAVSMLAASCNPNSSILVARILNF